jgi:1-phosphofructokinase family hexose kinase
VILVAGLSPAWQQILVFRQLQLGAVNRAVEATACASGKVLNVASAVAGLGAPVQTLCTLGGFTGDQVAQEFDARGLPAVWIRTSAATRVCTTLLDEATGRTTELVENVPPIASSEAQQFLARFRELAEDARLIVITGSFPPGLPDDFVLRLMDGVSCPTLWDVRGAELQQALSLRPWLVKPNREELAATLGRGSLSDEEVHAALLALHARGAERIVVSQGSEPLWCYGPEGLSRPVPPTVTVQNPIGCGDCLAAGLAVGHWEGQSWPQTLQLGLAAAADNARQLLPARLDRPRVNALLALRGDHGTTTWG